MVAVSWRADRRGRKAQWGIVVPLQVVAEVAVVDRLVLEVAGTRLEVARARVDEAVEMCAVVHLRALHIVGAVRAGVVGREAGELHLPLVWGGGGGGERRGGGGGGATHSGGEGGGWPGPQVLWTSPSLRRELSGVLLRLPDTPGRRRGCVRVLRRRRQLPLGNIVPKCMPLLVATDKQLDSPAAPLHVELADVQQVPHQVLPPRKTDPFDIRGDVHKVAPQIGGMHSGIRVRVSELHVLYLEGKEQRSDGLRRVHIECGLDPGLEPGNGCQLLTAEQIEGLQAVDEFMAVDAAQEVSPCALFSTPVKHHSCGLPRHSKNGVNQTPPAAANEVQRLF
eukprot:Sspe_Gene.66382::Locus_39226_Transcript_1_2_Confidence_0.800_Length_1341::g.66382::m.66382